LGSVEVEDVGINPCASAFTATCKLVIELRGPPFIRFFIAMCASGDLLSSFAHGVGQKVFGEDFLAVFVDFTEGDCPESCPLCGEGESADS
jgi:hypothetical protein